MSERQDRGSTSPPRRRYGRDDSDRDRRGTRRRSRSRSRDRQEDTERRKDRRDSRSRSPERNYRRSGHESRKVHSSNRDTGIQAETTQPRFSNRSDNGYHQRQESSSSNASYQRPAAAEPKFEWGRREDAQPEEETMKEPQFKPDFGLSGALSRDERTGNMVNGVILKFTEPFEASIPDKRWRLYVYKGEELAETLHIHRRSCFLVGRDDRVADIHILHPSSSLQHAVIQYRSVDVKRTVDGERKITQEVIPYLLDLKSTHGTFLNGEKIEDSRYYELREGDVIKFGGSTRDYVLLHDQSGKD